jgi:hypothetical protein
VAGRGNLCACVVAAMDRFVPRDDGGGGDDGGGVRWRAAGARTPRLRHCEARSAVAIYVFVRRPQQPLATC